MIHRDVVALPAHVFPPEEWRVVELGFSQGLLHRAEAIFALSNGHFGMRGNVDESSPAHERGAYVNGFHDTWPIHHPEQAFGFARTGQTIVALPDAKVIDLYVDEEPLYLPSAILTRYERALDMSAGVLDRDLTWQTRSGKTVSVSSKRMVSFHHRHMAEAAVVHQSQRVDGGVGRGHVLGVVRHHHVQMRVRRVLAVGQQMHGITAGEDAGKLAVIVGDEDRADPVLAHQHAGLLHRRRLR